MMHGTAQPQEMWRSSTDLISVRTDKQESSSRSSVRTKKISKTGNSRSSVRTKKISKTGGVHYLKEAEEGYGDCLQEMVGRYHSHSCEDGRGQFMRCSSVLVQQVEAPVSVVWSLVRRFDEPQIYKHFVRSCSIRSEGDVKVKVGCLREVRVVSGLPAATSTERLDILDEKSHILSFSIVGGDHRLNNYRSITSLHERIINGEPGTVVIESYVVDVPQGNTKEETCLFVETIVKCNLQSLADVSKHLICSTSS